MAVQPPQSAEELVPQLKGFSSIQQVWQAWDTGFPGRPALRVREEEARKNGDTKGKWRLDAGVSKQRW